MRPSCVAQSIRDGFEDRIMIVREGGRIEQHSDSRKALQYLHFPHATEGCADVFRFVDDRSRSGVPGFDATLSTSALAIVLGHSVAKAQ